MNWIKHTLAQKPIIAPHGFGVFRISETQRKTTNIVKEFRYFGKKLINPTDESNCTIRTAQRVSIDLVTVLIGILVRIQFEQKTESSVIFLSNAIVYFIHVSRYNNVDHNKNRVIEKLWIEIWFLNLWLEIFIENVRSANFGNVF